MRDPFSLMGAPREKKPEPEGDMARDGFVTLERGKRGSYSPWGSNTMDLKNDDGPFLTIKNGDRS